jgi:hypothetical protein
LSCADALPTINAVAATAIIPFINARIVQTPFNKRPLMGLWPPFGRGLEPGVNQPGGLPKRQGSRIIGILA